MADSEIIPPEVIADEKSVQMLRVWIAQQKLICLANVGIYKESPVKEETAWGIILCDVIRHISDALSKLDGSSKEQVMGDIIRSLLREHENETGGAKSGDFVTRDDVS